MQTSRSRALLAAALVCVGMTMPTFAGAVGNPTLPSNPCLAGKIKCVIKRTSCSIGCYAKAAKAGVALNNATDACLAKCRDKFDGGVNGEAAGCFGKLEAKGGCLQTGDTSPIGVKSDVFVLNALKKLDPAPLDNPSTCRSGKLKCVSKYDKCVQGLFAKAAKLGGQIDASKLDKCLAIITGGTKGLEASCFGKLDAKGNCETSADGGVLREQGDAYIDDTLAGMMFGPIDVHNERCSGNTAVQCTSAPGGTAGCGGPLGTCEFWFGSSQPLAIGGVGVCATNQWSGPLTGTLNQQTGAAAWDGTLKVSLYLAPSVSAPCPQCNGDTSPSDGLREGTCSDGPRSGLACDANGATSVAEFGATSLDCPLSIASLIASERVSLASNNAAASLTLSAASPSCTGAPGKKCACAGCSGDSTLPCANDADCAAAGAGTCTSFAGEPGRPNSCDDGTTVGDGTLCVDTGPVGDGSGSCPEGPFNTFCAVEQFRSCGVDSDCPAPGDLCIARPRSCFLDNGLIGGAVTAQGGHSIPVDHASYGTFASVHCFAASSAAAVNLVVGFPGAGRLTIGGVLSENGTDASCPTRSAFAVTDADGVQDLGWTGLAHDQRYVTPSKLSVSVTGCSGAAPACGECTFTGPILNEDAIPLPPSKTVFVSSATTSGSIGNLGGADLLCQQLATAAGRGGVFKAWLSNAVTSAASRLTHSADDYTLVDGTVVAHGWTDLTDGSLAAPINQDEYGTTVSASVWTNSTADGSIDSAECQQWTSTAVGQKGQTGLSTATNAAWTDNIAFEDCALLRHLYCIKQ